VKNFIENKLKNISQTPIIILKNKTEKTHEFKKKKRKKNQATPSESPNPELIS
jgi:hypothetical protein